MWRPSSTSRLSGLLESGSSLLAAITTSGRQAGGLQDLGFGHPAQLRRSHWFARWLDGLADYVQRSRGRAGRSDPFQRRTWRKGEPEPGRLPAPRGRDPCGGGQGQGGRCGAGIVQSAAPESGRGRGGPPEPARRRGLGSVRGGRAAARRGAVHVGNRSRFSGAAMSAIACFHGRPRAAWKCSRRSHASQIWLLVARLIMWADSTNGCSSAANLSTCGGQSCGRGRAAGGGVGEVRPAGDGGSGPLAGEGACGRAERGADTGGGLHNAWPGITETGDLIRETLGAPASTGRLSALSGLLLLPAALRGAVTVTDAAGNAKLAKSGEGGRRQAHRDDAAAAVDTWRLP